MCCEKKAAVTLATFDKSPFHLASGQINIFQELYEDNTYLELVTLSGDSSILLPSDPNYQYIPQRCKEEQQKLAISTCHAGEDKSLSTQACRGAHSARDIPSLGMVTEDRDEDADEDEGSALYHQENSVDDQSLKNAAGVAKNQKEAQEKMDSADEKKAKDSLWQK
ncbi:hypothetical protein WISP_113675 [Willisornis vidua]|uniref:CE192 protein n=1 Tax=Willisornis vidua TaxID=1566151 RepID=A0ABQ9CUT9_9PASS|nr:hypothetical protein WISP_113675 [Willisornis vidua]